MDIDRNAPVITRGEILIAAPIETIWNVQTNIPSWPTWQPEVETASIDGPLAVGTVFHWQTGGLNITSTIQEIDPRRRIVWSGPAQGIEAVHVWTLTPVENGARVHTEESWNGEPVRSQVATMQQALDQSLKAWLENLKRTTENSIQR
ncbi:MAG: SRPBCC family protein [Ktedonobacteraceae bacterium]|nr:SRPBCC family protein [Ktedonobacteraceae bacterium]